MNEAYNSKFERCTLPGAHALDLYLNIQLHKELAIIRLARGEYAVSFRALFPYSEDRAESNRPSI